MKIKVLNLPNGDKRIVFGKFLELVDLDYSQKPDDLKRDIQFALSIIERNPDLFANCLNIQNKNTRIIQDSHKIEIVDDDEKISLNWLTIEDKQVIFIKE